MHSPCIAHVPHPDAAPERELAALVSIYSRAINRHEKTKAAGRLSSPDGPNDAKEIKDVRAIGENTG